MARVIPVVPSVAISAFCGILEMNVFKYFVISFVGVFFRGIILGAIGWQVGNVYEKYAQTISSIENIVLLSTILVLGIFIVLKYKSRLKG
jgi:membrane protein DedA with SNARE-associated domain